MGKYYKERWISDGSGQTKDQRASGVYKYYVPTKLMDLNVKLEPDVSGDISAAEQALQALDNSAKTLKSSEGVARLLLRGEALSSSYIEGLSINAKRILQEELKIKDNVGIKADTTAASVVGNINAMNRAINANTAKKAITIDTIQNIHKELCKNTRIKKYGGVIRQEQNWIGGTSFNPLSADYIPPDSKFVEALMKDLCDFCNKKNISPVVKAAFVHAQFETIHPFADGNGRTGRALIHLILRQNGFIKNFTPPISLIMATYNNDYVNGLTNFRILDSDSDGLNTAKLNNWISYFAWCCKMASEESQKFEERAKKNEDYWRKKLGRVRKNSALDKMIGELTGMPIFTINTAKDTLNMSFDAVSAAVEKCLAANIIIKSNSFKRNRVFEVPKALDQLNWFERKLASPAGNTSISSPKRPVPSKN